MQVVKAGASLGISSNGFRVQYVFEAFFKHVLVDGAVNENDFKSIESH